MQHWYFLIVCDVNQYVFLFDLNTFLGLDGDSVPEADTFGPVSMMIRFQEVKHLLIILTLFCVLIRWVSFLNEVKISQRFIGKPGRSYKLESAFAFVELTGTNFHDGGLILVDVIFWKELVDTDWIVIGLGGKYFSFHQFEYKKNVLNSCRSNIPNRIVFLMEIF